MASLDPWSYAEKTRTEHAEQVALFMWANCAFNFGLTMAEDAASYVVAGHAKRGLALHNDAIPELKWLHAIHNQGHGDAIRGGKAKAEGVKAGVFDVSLPVPRQHVYDKGTLGTRMAVGGYAGLYLELKRKDAGKPSDIQLEFQTDMRAAGYKAEIIHGWELARLEILRYLGRLTI